MAARRAGVDYTSAYALRKRDAGFAAAWAKALAAGRARVVDAAGDAAAEVAGAEAWGADVAGPEAAGVAAGAGAGVTGAGVPRRRGASRRSGGRASGGGQSEEVAVRVSRSQGPQMVRVGAGRWSAAAEARFLESLSARANVRLACAKAGFSDQAVHARRRRDPVFAAKWDHALAEAKARVRLLLIDAVEVALDPALVTMPGDGDCGEGGDAGRPVGLAEAIAVLRMLDAREQGKLDGRARLRGQAPIEPPIEEVRAAILERIEAMERHGGKGDDRAEGSEGAVGQ